MTIKITGRAASDDDNANFRIAGETVERFGKRVAHLLGEINVLGAAQGDDGYSIGYRCSQNVCTHWGLPSLYCHF